MTEPPGRDPFSTADRIGDTTRLECRICWHVYDPAEGDDVEQGLEHPDLGDVGRVVGGRHAGAGLIRDVGVGHGVGDVGDVLWVLLGGVGDFVWADDGDGIQDGTESGLDAAEGTDTDPAVFIPDADGNMSLEYSGVATGNYAARWRAGINGTISGTGSALHTPVEINDLSLTVSHLEYTMRADLFTAAATDAQLFLQP